MDDIPVEKRGVIVFLTKAEMIVAAICGILRQIEAIFAGKVDAHEFKGDPWRVHIEGCCAEMAAAKALDVYWVPTVNTYRTKPDLGKFEIRRRSRNDYDVLIRQRDSDVAIHIAVFGQGRKYRVAGWLEGHEAKKAEWLQTHGGRPAAWFMPQDRLHDLRDIWGGPR